MPGDSPVWGGVLTNSDILAHPCSGIGKPELLRYDHSGYWSRRINKDP
ncbi:MAG: type II toxin-antitoxin system YoeB family toxin [Puniceicoccales bacterium]|nr:type II toxin-antitoxin system YoeB family toxin [Puniceicoccales bacterium]